MITKPTAQPRALRHPYSTRGLSLRLLLLGAMLTSLAVAVAGGQPVGARSSDGREPASGSTGLADGDGAGGPGRSPGDAGRVQRADGGLSGQASDGSPGGVMPAASASPGGSPPSGGSAGSPPSGGSAGAPPDDWHRYHHWTDPSWPEPGQATGERGDSGQRDEAPFPARTAGEFGWEPPSAPATDPTPSDGWTTGPGDPMDPPLRTPAPSGSTTTNGPAPDPAVPDEEPTTPTEPDTTGAPGAPDSPGQGQPDGAHGPGTGALPSPDTGDPRDPVAAGPGGEDLGLGDTVDDPSPTPAPTGQPPTPVRAAPADTQPAGGYHRTLVYSGLFGLALAVIGLAMVGLRRRRW